MKTKEDGAVLAGGGLGAWGIVTGYGLFLVLWHERHHAARFLVALLVAALASFLIEHVRARIEGGGHGHGISGPRFAVTILVLAIAELFVVAAHTAANPPHGAVDVLGEALLGPLPAGLLPKPLTVGAMIFVWLALGCVLGAALARAVGREKGGFRRQLLSGAAGGAVAGGVVAPIAMLALVLLARAAASVWLMVLHHDAWRASVDRIAAGHGWLFLLTAPIRFADWLWREFAWGKWLVLGGGGAILAGAIRGRETPLLRWILLGFAVVIGLPLLADLEALLKLLLLAAVAWGVPGVVLGAFSPMLKRPAEHTPAWGVTALAGAGLLMLLTIPRLLNAWFLVPAALLLLAGSIFRRGGSAADWWPFPALVCALAVTGSARLSQQATFGGILEAFHSISAPRPPDPPRPLDPASFRWNPLEIPSFRFPSFSFPPPTLSRVQYAEKWAGLATLAKSDADRAALSAYSELGRLPLEERLAGTETMLARESPGTAALLGSPQPFRLALRAILGSDASELRAALALLPPAAEMNALAEQYDRVEEALRSWNTPVALQRAEAARELVSAELVRRQGAILDALDDSPPVALAEVADRLDELRRTPFRTEPLVARAGAEARRLGRQLRALQESAYAPLVAEAGALERLDEEESLARGEALLRSLAAAAPGFRDEESRGRIASLRGAVERRVESTRAGLRASAGRLLELSLAGSLGFWVSVALLAAWAARRSHG